MPRLLREMKGAVGPDVVGMAALASGSAEERLVVAHGSGQVKVRERGKWVV